MSASRELLQDTAAALDALLRVRYPDDNDRPQRELFIGRCLANEASRLDAAQFGTKGAAVLDLLDLADRIAGLGIEAVQSIRSRCLFYACDDLISLLVNRRIRTDSIAREEAILYVQDRLQRDDFRRIRTYTRERGASFVTYMWQVINNLLLDFLRKQEPHAPRYASDLSRGDADTSEVDGGSAAAPIEDSIVNGQLRDMLSEVLAEKSGVASAMHPLRERLRPHLTLTAKEKIFLRAMFQYDMNINEIRAMPGFEMGVNEAYRFYYGIMERLLGSFKEAGVLERLRTEVSATIPRVSVDIEGERATVLADAIHYLQQSSRQATLCGVEWRGQPKIGVADEGFSKLSKHLGAFFTPINSQTAVADRVLPACGWGREGVLTITGFAKEFRVGKRLWARLKERSMEKSPARVRI